MDCTHGELYTNVIYSNLQGAELSRDQRLDSPPRRRVHGPDACVRRPKVHVAPGIGQSQRHTHAVLPRLCVHRAQASLIRQFRHTTNIAEVSPMVSAMPAPAVRQREPRGGAAGLFPAGAIPRAAACAQRCSGPRPPGQLRAATESCPCAGRTRGAARAAPPRPAGRRRLALPRNVPAKRCTHRQESTAC